MRVCELLFPEVSFEAMPPGHTPEQMAENINAIIDYIEELFPEEDISDLDGYKIVGGDLTNIYVFLDIIYTLILSSLEEEEEEDEEIMMMKKLKEAEMAKQKEKERELQEKQLIEDPSALPVGNIRDLLRKKKKNTEIIQKSEEKSGKKAGAKDTKTSAKGKQDNNDLGGMDALWMINDI